MEIKKLVLKRVPPGDRWTTVDSTQILPTLTEALNAVFEDTGYRKYYIDAAAGEVYSVVFEEDKPIPPKRYSLYED